jgi:putative selenate reductase
MDLHVIIKLNPTLLGKQHVEHLLHDVLGYHDILVTQDAFDHDLQFDQALEMIPRLEEVARSRGKRLGVKFSNTLVVKNHRTFFTDETMYMSGAPLHVLTLNLVDKFRAALGRSIPTSFSAGLDANNMAYCVAMNLVPVTTCTDLLRPGGYSRLSRYMDRLGEKMREMNVTAIPDFVVRYAGQAETAVQRAVEDLKRDFRAAGEGGDPASIAPALSWIDNMLAFRLREWAAKHPEPLAQTCSDIREKFRHAVSAHLPEALASKLDAAVDRIGERVVEAAGMLNTPILVKEATENPRYAFVNNKAVPRKIGSKLWLYDCINCDKCVPDCPNDANFVYDTKAAEFSYMNYEISEKGHLAAVPGGTFKVTKSHQLANYADACNDCGNCDVFCPEDGGPQVEKPRFFGSFASYRKYAGRNGFFVEFDAGSRTIHGVIAGHHYVLTVGHERAWFDDGAVELELDVRQTQVLAVKPKPSREAGKHVVDMLPYHQLKLLLESISNPSRVHYANVGEFQGKTRDQKEGAVPGTRLHHHAGMD